MGRRPGRAGGSGGMYTAKWLSGSTVTPSDGSFRSSLPALDRAVNR